MTSFSDLLYTRELLALIQQAGYRQPTDIQASAIPLVLEGRSLVGAAPTGTGKTAAYVLPVIEMCHQHPQLVDEDDTVLSRVLLIAPTRELAHQLWQQMDFFGRPLDLSVALISGGESLQDQNATLIAGADCLIATPGRLLEILHRDPHFLDHIQCLILDEADRLLDLGFSDDLKRILKCLPKQHQSLLFSATYNQDVKALAEHLIPNAVYLGQALANRTATNVTQILYPVDHQDKAAATLTLLEDNRWRQTLVFTKTKKGAEACLKHLLDNNVSADLLHGDRKPHERRRVMQSFKQGKLAVLVATDVAARGLDIQHLPAVINHDLPPVAEDYIHRVGRTGRAGDQGLAISLVAAHECDTLTKIESLLGYCLPRQDLIGHVPNHRVPETKIQRVKKPNRTKPGSSSEASNAEGKTKTGSQSAALHPAKNKHGKKAKHGKKVAKNGNALFQNRKNITKRSID